MFAQLVTTQSRWKFFVVGWGIQVNFLLAILAINALFPRQMQQAKNYVYTNIVAPVEPTITQLQPINPRLQAKIKPVPVEIPTVDKLAVPRQVREIREHAPDVEAPEIKLPSKAFDLPKLANTSIAKVVATSTFATPTNVMPTTTRPAAQVQTGGFGDFDGIPATGDGKHDVNIATKGNPGLPMGAGFGNGLGSTKGIAGVGIVGNGTVKSSGFDKQYAPIPKQVAAVVKESGTPVEIIEKPKPLYTEEGRKRGVEGEVRLEVRFKADGHVRVLRVLQGLGFGLDEQALHCAEQIKFKPAMHDGQAIDSTAVVHIVFELAS